MPIHVGAAIRRMDDEEFKARTFEVMGHVFDVQRELGRLFQETVYQRELVFRIPDARREVPVEVRFEEFSKTYYLDLLVDGGAVFELKAVQSLTERHRQQLLHYLFLADLPHGKLINLRSERVQHEFVNNTLTRSDRASFDVDNSGWQDPGTTRLKDRMIAVLRDWGAGLDIGLYEEVASHLCGQPPGEEANVEIRMAGRSLGLQSVRLVAPCVALRITALPPDGRPEYEAHLFRFLDHTDLDAVQWINVTRHLVQFRTIEKRR
jgi:GxxExxY protein